MFGIFFQFIQEIITSLNKNIMQVKQNINVLSTTSSNMSITAQNVSINTDSTQGISTAISVGANEQTILLNSTLTAMDSMISDVNDIVDTIIQSSQNVGQIALQTNILALNAGIEASRAGDYGRGFAVVAENVRKLSDESKNAAGSISEVSVFISEMLQEKMRTFKTMVSNIASVSEENSASSEELVASMNEIQANILQLTQDAEALSHQVIKTEAMLNTN